VFVYADGVSMAIGFEPNVRSHQHGLWTIDRCGRSVVSNRSRRYEQYGEGGVDEGDEPTTSMAPSVSPSEHPSTPPSATPSDPPSLLPSSPPSSTPTSSPSSTPSSPPTATPTHTGTTTPMPSNANSMSYQTSSSRHLTLWDEWELESLITNYEQPIVPKQRSSLQRS